MENPIKMDFFLFSETSMCFFVSIYPVFSNMLQHDWWVKTHAHMGSGGFQFLGPTSQPEWLRYIYV